MKVIIAGGRDFLDYELLKVAIKDSCLEITEVVCGEAKGADLLGRRWAEENNIPIASFPAKWKDLSGEDGYPVKTNHRYGNSYNACAGHNRNIMMAKYADELIAFWDGKSRGTMHMIATATKENLNVKIYNY
jgi:hypothetical protein